MTAFIRTYSGKKFHYVNIKPSSIDMEDVAHSLSNLCRFTGHTKFFYSVAQHSILVYKLAKKIYPKDYQVHYLALMHECTEAFMNDLCSPIKYMDDDTGLKYRKLEDRICDAVSDKYNLTKDPVAKAMVKHCDRIALDIEGHQLVKGWELQYVSEDIIESFCREFPCRLSSHDIEKKVFLNLFRKLSKNSPKK